MLMHHLSWKITHFHVIEVAFIRLNRQNRENLVRMNKEVKPPGGKTSQTKKIMHL